MHLDKLKTPLSTGVVIGKTEDISPETEEIWEQINRKTTLHIDE